MNFSNSGMRSSKGGYTVFPIAISIRAAPVSVLRPLFSFGLAVVAVLAVDRENG